MIPVRQVAAIKFPTHWGNFRLLAFEATQGPAGTVPQTALALILGDIYKAPPIVRIHSQCSTGDVFHSLRCDCHDQLHLALRSIAENGSGIVLYEHQEGRGIGLMEKLRAYELQDQGFDTIDANLQLGHAIDLRDYTLPTDVLRFLNIHSLRLMTNNPDKIQAVSSAGINIVERLSADVLWTQFSADYMTIKRDKLGHLTGRTESFTPQ